MNYDTMSVHELVMEIYYAGAECAADKRQMLEPILCRKVIEEASVGRIEGTLVEVRNPVLPEYSHLDPRITIRWNENRLSFDVEKSDLLLIPISKETP